jgi:hypothetical protein
MVTPNDKMSLAIAIQDYEKQKANYHFYNWELAELERCERIINDIIAKYATNIPDIIELGQELPSLQRFIPGELMQEIHDYVNSQKNEMNVFYSFDGQKHSTLDEAVARNEILIGMLEKPKTR